MMDWYVVLTPLLVFAILVLFRFVGCNQIFGLKDVIPRPPVLILSWEGMVRDRVGQGKSALAPDGAVDGTLTVTMTASGGRTVTQLKLDSYKPNNPSPVGTWDTDIHSTYFVLGASTGLDDPLLNDANAAVSFFVAEDDSFVVFASDLQDMEFLSGNTLSLAATFSDTTTASAQVVIP
jgi:hypothetical protein